MPKSIQATVTLLENLHVILQKTPRDDIRAEVLPMLYNAFESTTLQVQVRHLQVVPIVVLWQGDLLLCTTCGTNWLENGCMKDQEEDGR